MFLAGERSTCNHNFPVFRKYRVSKCKANTCRAGKPGMSSIKITVFIPLTALSAY